MKLNYLIFTILFVYSSAGFSAEDHSAMMNHDGHQMKTSTPVLTEAGNDAFGTIQEVIVKLSNDPDTDWSKVDIEALRKHLVDMNDMTLNVEVVYQKPIQNGLEAVIRPTTDRAASMLVRVFKAHPPQLKRETGWDMKVVNKNGQYILMATTTNPAEVNKIRGLGYIGLMAYGSHHQPHHWAMATGKNPHDAH